MKLKFVQRIIDILRGKRKTRFSVWCECFKIQKKYGDVVKKLKIKIKNGEKIKIAFLIMYSTSSQLYSIFEQMLKSDIFEPYIIVNPDVSRSRENFEFNYNRTKREMIEKYGKEIVFDGYDFDTNLYFDYTADFDLMFTNNPYDHMAHQYFRIKYWAQREVPICYVSYFYMGRCYITMHNLSMPEFSMFWKFFAENNYTKKLASKHQILKGKNVVVTGYAKLDELAKIQEVKRERKKIILAMHHSINMDFLTAFFEYCDLLLELPAKYPDIDFVFRPHPLLIQNLKKSEFWGEKKTEEYLSNLLKFNNITYSTEGNYFDLFVNSDGLIHDCGSFMAEYLCTGHPAAFLCFKKDLKKKLTPFGIKILDNHYQVSSQKEVYDFIDNIVINNKDYMYDKRVSFAKNELLINWPNAAKSIYENIVKELT